MTSDPGPVFLVQLAPASGNQIPPRDAEPATLDEFVDRLPDAFVVIDRNGIIRRANRAFLDLAQVGGEGALLGERLSRFLSRPGADLTVLLANLQRHGSVRIFETSILGDLGGETAVEISAAANGAGNDDTSNRPRLIALLLRDVSRRLSGTKDAATLQSALAAIIEQAGKTSLRGLVKDTVGLVERHYMVAALRSRRRQPNRRRRDPGHEPPGILQEAGSVPDGRTFAGRSILRRITSSGGKTCPRVP